MYVPITTANVTSVLWYFRLCIYDWLWKNPPLTHKDNYLEICNSIIQSVISREGSKLHAYNLLQIYSYLIATYKAAHCTIHS